MADKLRGWGHYGELSSDNEASGLSIDAHHEDYVDSQQQSYSPTYSGGNSGLFKDQRLEHSHHTSHQNSHLATAAALVRSTSSLAKKVPGARSVSYLNAAMLGACGLVAAATAWLAVAVMLAGLLARVYLPSYEYHRTIPLFFDYSVGPATAGTCVPLLRRTSVTASLTPPAVRSASRAATGGSSSNADTFQGSGGFLGLGISPANRLRSSASSSGSSSRGHRRGSSRSSSSSGVDVGGGVLVPEQDWLVPRHGRMQLTVELDMPDWPAPDLVQVTTDLISQQGLVLGRSTRTWVPQPSPLLIRVLSFFIWGPWKAVGLVSSVTRIRLPMFEEGFQNPAPPPGGWGSVKHLLNPDVHAHQHHHHQQQQQPPQGAAEAPAPGTGSKGSKGSSAKSKPQGSRGDNDDGVSPPRAMWLRVTVIGRSAGNGPPRIYRAAAKVTMHLGLFDRLAAALRPSLPVLLLLAAMGAGMAIGGAGTAAVLLLLAYLIYTWGSSIDSDGSEQQQQPQEQQQQQQQHWEGPSEFEGAVDGYSAGGSPSLNGDTYPLLTHGPGMSKLSQEESATHGLFSASGSGVAAGIEHDSTADSLLTYQQQHKTAAGSISSAASPHASGGSLFRMFGSGKKKEAAAEAAAGAAAAAAPAGSSDVSVKAEWDAARSREGGWGKEELLGLPGHTDDDDSAMRQLAENGDFAFAGKAGCRGGSAGGVSKRSGFSLHW